MAMVRRGVMDSFRLASCWRVEVVKGGEGERCLSWRLTVLTVKTAFFTASTTASTSWAERSSRFFPFSPWYRARKVFFSVPSVVRRASRDQYSWGWKAAISCSRSQTIRVATDWTRPADRPRRIFFHSRGESW